MSLTRPADLPVWATAGSVTVPSSGKQATGWVLNESPAHDYFNWHQNSVFNWVEYLDEQVPARETVGYSYKAPVSGSIDLDFAAGTYFLEASGSHFLSAQTTTIDISTASPWVGYVSLNEHLDRITSIAAENITITTIQVVIKWTSGTFIAELETILRGLGGSTPATPTVIASSGGTTSTNFKIITITVNAALNRASFVYRLKLSASGHATSTDMRIHDVVVNYTKTRVE